MKITSRLAGDFSKRRILLWMVLLGAAGLFVLDAGAQQPAESVGNRRILNLVFIGDSITQGVGSGNADTLSAPVICASELGKLLPGGAKVYFSNQGHSGQTTQDFQPGSENMKGVDAAAKGLTAAHPDGKLVFSIMLGTNDSANSGPNGSPISADRYRQNMRNILNFLIGLYPGCQIFLHRPTWYSFNTHNNADYEGEAPVRLQSYFPILDALANGDSLSIRRHIYSGDTDAYKHFAGTYLAELRPEDGRHGTFYLHPNTKGAEALGKYWAMAIAKELAR